MTFHLWTPIKHSPLEPDYISFLEPNQTFTSETQILGSITLPLNNWTLTSVMSTFTSVTQTLTFATFWLFRTFHYWIWKMSLPTVPKRSCMSWENLFPTNNWMHTHISTLMNSCVCEESRLSNVVCKYCVFYSHSVVFGIFPLINSILLSLTHIYMHDTHNPQTDPCTCFTRDAHDEWQLWSVCVTTMSKQCDLISTNPHPKNHSSHCCRISLYK